MKALEIIRLRNAGIVQACQHFNHSNNVPYKLIAFSKLSDGVSEEKRTRKKYNFRGKNLHTILISRVK